LIFAVLWTLPYRLDPGRHETEATVNKVSMRQRSLLLNEPDRKSPPQEIEARVFELLVELLIDLVPTLEGRKCDEQDHK